MLYKNDIEIEVEIQPWNLWGVWLIKWDAVTSYQGLDVKRRTLLKEDFLGVKSGFGV